MPVRKKQHAKTDTAKCSRCSAFARMTARDTGPLSSIQEEVFEKKLLDQLEQSPNSWRLHDTLNAPYCDVDCNCCEAYFSHYLTCQASHSTNGNENSGMIVTKSEKKDNGAEEDCEDDEEEYEVGEGDDEVGEGDDEVGEGDDEVGEGDDDVGEGDDEDEDNQSDDTVWAPPTDFDDTTLGDGAVKQQRSETQQHMHNLVLLQSNNGRLRTNPIFDTDPAALGREQETIAPLAMQIIKRDEQHNIARNKVAQKAGDWRREPIQCLYAGVGAGQVVGIFRDEVEMIDIETLPCVNTVWSDKDKRLHNEFVKRKLPEASEPATQLAKWIQSHQWPIHGVHSGPPHWSVDLRDARGHQVVKTLASPSGRSKNARARHRKHFLTILRLLVIPAAYTTLIREMGTTIQNVTLSTVDFRAFDTSLDEHVAQAFAKHGLTAAIADDTWQFCYNFVRDEIAATDSVYDREVLIQLMLQADTEVIRIGKPQGLNTVEEDHFTRECSA
ncbi:hypothetical protein C8R43DRAFT_963525 [Mycena crocata]|nr:hypothetical protein C8R43DRAFT_963525 [Mycena crocata]